MYVGEVSWRNYQHKISYIFTNILVYQHTFHQRHGTLRYVLVKVFHQHTGFSPTYIFHQHPSPTLEQSDAQFKTFEMIEFAAETESDKLNIFHRTSLCLILLTQKNLF